MDPETLRKLAQGFIASLGEAKDSGGIIVRRPVLVQPESIDKAARTVRMRCSSDAVDSYGDVVKQNFRLDRYEKNPVVLYGHNRVGVFGAGGAPEWTLPIGFSTDIAIVENSLEVTMHFVDGKASPMAPLVWEGFLQGSIRASSIGFFPHDVIEEQDPETGEFLYTLDDNELFEISVVPIGANPDAVALAAQRKHEKAWFHTRALDLRKTTSLPPSPPPAPSPTENQGNQTMAMTAEEQKAFDDAKTAATKAEERAKAAEAQAQAFKDAESERVSNATVDALVGKKIKAEQKPEFVQLLKSAPDTFKSIVAGLPTLPEADDATAEKDVDALVGKKITPAQKGDFVTLRKLSPELFKSLTGGLLELAQTSTQTPPDKTPNTNKAAKKSGTSTLAKNAAAAGEKARAAS